MDTSQDYDPKRFTITDLKNAFERITHLVDDKYRICYFVDGLDEYEDNNVDHLWLAQTLTGWCQSEHVKIVCSARPHTVFLDTFKASGLIIHLHELNRHDIKEYTTQQFQRILEGQLHETARKKCLSIIGRIVERAEGVFLWVVLVVRSLLHTVLSHENDLEFLEQQLDEAPNDLKTLFRQLLQANKLSPSSSRRAETLLLLTLEGLSHDDYNGAIAYSFLEDASWYENSCRGPFPCENPWRIMPEEEITIRQERVRHMLHHFTNGLLGTIPATMRYGQEPGSYWKYRVSFLHRSVPDFLREDWIKEPEVSKRQQELRDSSVFIYLKLAELKFMPVIDRHVDEHYELGVIWENMLRYLGDTTNLGPLERQRLADRIYPELETIREGQIQLQKEQNLYSRPILRPIKFYWDPGECVVFERLWGQSINGSPDVEGSLLHLAALEGATGIVHDRLKAGDLGTTHDYASRMSLLLCVASSKSEDVIALSRYLLEHGAVSCSNEITGQCDDVEPRQQATFVISHLVALSLAHVAIRTRKKDQKLFLVLELYMELGADMDIFFLLKEKKRYNGGSWLEELARAGHETLRAELSDVINLARPPNEKSLLGKLRQRSLDDQGWWDKAVRLWSTRNTYMDTERARYPRISPEELQNGPWTVAGLVSRKGIYKDRFEIRLA